MAPYGGSKDVDTSGIGDRSVRSSSPEFCSGLTADQAGSDSGGGAGLEADQKVLAAHGCYAMTATTALTAQNTLGVEDIHVTPPAFVAKQINACLNDIRADVGKIGMIMLLPT